MFAEASSSSGKARSKCRSQKQRQSAVKNRAILPAVLSYGGSYLIRDGRGQSDTANKVKIYFCYNILYYCNLLFFRHIPFPEFLWRKNYCLKCAPSSFSSKTTKLTQTSGCCRYLTGLPPPLNSLAPSVAFLSCHQGKTTAVPSALINYRNTTALNFI